VYLGQRVAVMSSRPGRITHVVDIPDFGTDGDVRSDPDFARYRGVIWGLLHGDEPARAATQRTAPERPKEVVSVG
jgi:NitT/TauT family transport system ATP-binding protein